MARVHYRPPDYYKATHPAGWCKRCNNLGFPATGFVHACRLKTTDAKEKKK